LLKAIESSNDLLQAHSPGASKNSSNKLARSLSSPGFVSRTLQSRNISDEQAPGNI